MRVRSALAAFGTVAVAATACGGTQGGTASAMSTGTVSAVSADATSVPVPPGHGGPSLTWALPKFAVGSQLGWLLSAAPHAPLPAAEIEQHFDQAFRAAVPPSEINAALEKYPGTWRLVSLDAGTAQTALVAGIVAGTTELGGTISTDSSGLISGARLAPAPAVPSGPASWQALDAAAHGLAPDVGFEAATLGAGGSCEPLNTVAPAEPRPLASMFKLYVLGAVADAVSSGRLSWQQTVALSASLRSLPSGSLQIEPAGTRYTVSQLADLMISSSDNTAADELAALVGRPAVEAQVGLTSAHASLDAPFLRTRELFQLKYDDYPSYADAYLALSPAARLAYLQTVIDRLPLSGATATAAALASPRDAETVEWLASPSDLCAQFARLYRDAGRASLSPVAAALSFNDGGIGLDRSAWPLAWFKGGSETGVLTLGYLARSAAGRVVVVILELSDPLHAIPSSATLSALSLVHAAFGLANAR
jgi:beta-lactamase class A